MNFKLKGKTLLNGDIVSPEIPYAEFSDDLRPDETKKIVAARNYGHGMLMVYKQHRGNMHISNVVEMLEKMEKIYDKYSNEMFRINRMEG